MAENRPTMYQITYERRFFEKWYVMHTMVEETFLKQALSALSQRDIRNLKEEKVYPVMAITQD